ncbi:DoxX family protein [Paenibacillus puerhi]|uniref:DoxX family protein n=1 Tax=Paenibacillus puerhi TaxID=2692622 RepID=UPI001359D313|nr:DoxX family protein [Paenibacillus puerhi]
MKLNTNIGLLLFRVVLGLTFAIHGYQKFAGGIDNISGWFQSIQLPGFTAYLVAVIELVGGIAVILGLGTRFISALFAIIMVVAIFKVKLAAGFFGSAEAPGYELDLVLLILSAGLAFTGSPLLAVERMITRSEESSVSEA